MQRELLPKLLVDVAYVGNKSRDIMILGDYNQARPNGPTENATLQARRPIQGFQEIQIAWGGGEGTTTRCSSRSSSATRAASTC